MLTHTERIQLAKDLCTRLVRGYPDQVIVGGIYGSVVRGTDTPWSDLDMWFVVEDGCSAKGQHLIYRDIAVGYRVYVRQELEQILTIPSQRRPYHMGVLNSFRVLYGDTRLVDQWIDLGERVRREKFIAALEDVLPGFVVESYGRVHSCHYRQDYRDLSIAVWEVLFEMLTALCLLNQRWVTQDYYQGLEQSFVFAKIPEDYREIVPVLYNERDYDKIAPLADKLVANFWHLLAEEGISVMNHQSVKTIQI